MKPIILQKKIVGDFVLLASLPDMGRVGGIVSSFLAKYLKAEPVAEFISKEKPWVSHSDGIVKSIQDVYRLYYHDATSLAIFTGESQPQDTGELYTLCSELLTYARSMGHVRRLYSAGGYLREQLTGAPRVCGAVNNPRLKSVLAQAEIEPIGNEISTITWFNGLILGLAAEQNIDAVGLFGEISETTLPQPLAAKSILLALSKIEKIPIDTKLLDQQYESILDEVQKKKTPSEFRPGIG